MKRLFSSREGCILSCSHGRKQEAILGTRRPIRRVSKSARTLLCRCFPLYITVSHAVLRAQYCIVVKSDPRTTSMCFLHDFHAFDLAAPAGSFDVGQQSWTKIIILRNDYVISSLDGAHPLRRSFRFKEIVAALSAAVPLL